MTSCTTCLKSYYCYTVTPAFCKRLGEIPKFNLAQVNACDELLESWESLDKEFSPTSDYGKTDTANRSILSGIKTQKAKSQAKLDALERSKFKAERKRQALDTMSDLWHLVNACDDFKAAFGETKKATQGNVISSDSTAPTDATKGR